MTRRSLLVAFSVAHFAHHVTNSLLSALLPFIQSAFGLSYTSAGFLVSAYSIASGMTNAPLGVLADRIGARRVIVWGLVLIGLSSVAIGLSTEYWQLLAFLAVMGIASGTYHAPASALIAELFSSRRGMAMGTHTTAGHLSFFAAPLLAGILATAGTWRTPYLAFAIAPIACAVLLWRVAPMGTRSTGRHGWLATGSDIVDVARRIGALVSLSILFQVVISAAMTSSAPISSTRGGSRLASPPRSPASRSSPGSSAHRWRERSPTATAGASFCSWASRSWAPRRGR